MYFNTCALHAFRSHHNTTYAAMAKPSTIADIHSANAWSKGYYRRYQNKDPTPGNNSPAQARGNGVAASQGSRKIGQEKGDLGTENSDDDNEGPAPLRRRLRKCSADQRPRSLPTNGSSEEDSVLSNDEVPVGELCLRVGKKRREHTRGPPKNRNGSADSSKRRKMISVGPTAVESPAHKFVYGIQGDILLGNISSITAPWREMLTSNLELWEIEAIKGKGRGIVALGDISKGTIIAMYGGVIFDRKNEIPVALSYSLDMKDSGKTLAIDAYQWYNLPKYARAAVANEPNVDAFPNANIVWMNPYRNHSQTIFRIPVLTTTKEVLKGQEITVYYSGNSYLPVSISF